MVRFDTMDLNEIKQLEKNFKDHDYSFFINTKIESAHNLYTKPLGIFSDHPIEIDIKSRLTKEIQKGECRSFVVFGDAGSGKTSLALHLCNEYWKAISGKSKAEIQRNFYVPIYISLRQVELRKNCKNILSTFCKISPGNIKAANLENFNLLLFLDGFDELEDKINLWNHNNWWLPERTKEIKTVTFCKSIGLSASEREQWFTFGFNEKSKFISMQLFASSQIDDYVQKTVEFLRNVSTRDEDDPWCMTKKVTGEFAVWENDLAEYKRWLNKIFPDLKKLARNPYLLTIILQILPGVVEDFKRKCSESDSGVFEQEKEIRMKCSTEVGIYDEFVAQWFRYQAAKNVISKTNPGFIEIPMDHVEGFMLAYAQNLAFSLVSKNGGFFGDGSISEVDCNLWNLWKPTHNKELLDLVDKNPEYSKLFPQGHNDKDKGRLCNFLALRNACFLSYLNEFTFKFFHSSLVEYLSSREVFENLKSRFHFYLSSDDPIYDKEFGINVSNINDPVHYPLLVNLAQRAQTSEKFTNLLFEIIEKSSEILILSQMSANAITILRFAGISLSGRSFRNAQLAGANLSGGNFANSDFQFANLAGVNFQQSWLVECKFQGANFEKVNFGQHCPVELSTRGQDINGIIPYTQNGTCNLVITSVAGEVFNYSLENGIFQETEFQNYKDDFFLWTEDSVLLTQKLSEDIILIFFKFVPSATTLTVNVWNFLLNESMEPITVDIPKPTLIPTKYWISKEFLQDKSGSTPVNTASTYNSEEQKLLNKIERKESFYYYDIHLIRRDGIGLVILWSYFFKERTIKDSKPQILKIFEVETKEKDETIFKIYSDFPVSSWDIYSNKLAALQGAHFVTIFSLDPKTNIIFKDIFPTGIDTSVRDDITFSSNGQYLIYKSDFVHLCTINDAKVQQSVKLLEVELKNFTKFFVVYDNSCQMAAFSYDQSIYICTLPDGTILQKMNKYVLSNSNCPTFAFTEEASANSKLFSYVYAAGTQAFLETFVISDTKKSISHQNVKGRRKLVVSANNDRFASYNRKEAIETSILSVFATPVSPPCLLFRKEIHSEIQEMLFTPNYLLVTTSKKVLVLDMNGTFHQSIELSPDCTTFVSSKCQQIVLYVNGIIQLYNIVETVSTDGSLAPVTFESTECNLRLKNMSVGRLTFDSKDGSHILLEEGVATVNEKGNVWLWVPSKNICFKTNQTDVGGSTRLIGTRNFYVIYNKNKRKLCVTDHLFLSEISSNDSLKMVKRSRNKFGFRSSGKLHLNVDCYACGNEDGEFCIYHLKNKKLLVKFLFPHSVREFNLNFRFNSSGKVLQAVDILAWDYDGNISSLLIDDMNLNVANDPLSSALFSKWKLNWTLNSKPVLNFKNSIIAKTFKVNERNKRLHHSFNISDKGRPWPERYKYFSLSELYAPITEADTKYAIINTEEDGRPRLKISADKWIVSAIARNSKSILSRYVHIEHIGLLIEGINNGRHFLVEADLIREKGFVQIRLRPVDSMKRLKQLEFEYIVMQWERPKADVDSLIQSIRHDQVEVGRKYNLLRNNCATWCFEKLNEIGIESYRREYRNIFVIDLPSDLFQIKLRIVKNRLPFNPSKSTCNKIQEDEFIKEERETETILIVD